MRRPQTTALAVASLGALAAILPAGAVAAGKPRAFTAPAYTGNTVKIEAPKKALVAGTVQRVRFAGHAHWNSPSIRFEYTLAMYVQDTSIERHCDPTYGGQRRNAINLPGLNASTSISGFVLDEEQAVQPREGVDALDWTGRSPPFAVRPGVRRVALCLYQRYLIDDVAFYELPVRVRQPRCHFRGGSVRHGRRIGLRCNFSGRLNVRLSRRGERTRVRRTTIGKRGGRGRISSRGLSSGRWKARFTTGKIAVGRDRIRVRGR